MSDGTEVIIKEAPTGAEAPAQEAKPYAGPDYIPEKFRTAEDPAKAMAESYAAAEAELTKLKAAKPAEQAKEGEKAKEGENKEGAKGATQVGALDPFFEEFTNTGALSDDSFKKLEDAGYPRNVVEQYIAGQTALLTAAGNELKSSVPGGEAAYTGMLEWGATGLSEDERKAYDNVLASGDMAAAKVMAAALVQKFQAATGTDPAAPIQGHNTKPSSGAYRSRDEMMRDMSKPEYQTDPAFQQEVQRRAMASNF